MPTNRAAPIPRPTLPKAPLDSERAVALVRHAQQGNAEAFGEIYQAYHDTVFRYIYYRVSTRALAEDLTSETFVRALRSIGNFTWRGRDFGAWLVTIARNLIADHFKSSRHRLEVTTGEMLDPGDVEPDVGGVIVALAASEAVREAVQRLIPSQRHCIQLRFFHHLTVAETAAAMGKTVGGIKTLQYRAIRSLNSLLDPETLQAA